MRSAASRHIRLPRASRIGKVRAVRKLLLVKPFTIAGFVVGEIYMLFTVLAPHLQGEVVPLAALIKRLLVLAIFFGPFGAAVGLGLGLIAQAIANTRRR